MDRKELIKLGAAAVRKNFKGAISEVASKALEFPSVWASTGSLSFDRLCAGRNPGGIPMGPSMGRIIHIYGEWACGKSLILDELFRSVIVDLKGIAKCTETEGSRDPHFAQAIGLPLDLLSVDRPDTFEQAFDMFETWHEEIRKQDDEIPILWGFDSLDSTEADKSARQGLSESGGWHFGGGRAEVLGAGLRRMARICSRYPTTMVMLNQTRDNVGVLFGDKKRTPGGNPPHFYCVTPETRILTSDLRWVEARKLSVGDKLLAFDEYPIRATRQTSTRRKTAGAEVTHAGIISRPVYKLTLSDGTVLRSSKEHRWLVSKKRSYKRRKDGSHRTGFLQQWRTTAQIAEDYRLKRPIWLLRFLTPWEEDTSYEAGWIAGMLDGEGCLHFRKDTSKSAGAPVLSFVQKEGLILDEMKNVLTRRKIGFRYSEKNDNTAYQIFFTGEWSDRFATLGMFRPLRLLKKVQERIESGMFRMDVCSSHRLRIVDVEFEGEQDVAAIATTTATYFAEGFGAHNSSLEIALKGSSRPDKGFVRAQSKMPDLTKEAIKRLGLYDADKGSVLGRYITAKVTKTKIGPTFDTTAEFYIDFRNGVHRWEGFAERLMFEGILKTGRDANTDYEMNGQKFATKQEWLNWLAAELRNGNWEVVNGALPEAKP